MAGVVDEGFGPRKAVVLGIALVPSPVLPSSGVGPILPGVVVGHLGIELFVDLLLNPIDLLLVNPGSTSLATPVVPRGRLGVGGV